MRLLLTGAAGVLGGRLASLLARENLAHYKVPKSIECGGELPKTDVGKVPRRELREEEEEK